MACIESECSNPGPLGVPGICNNVTGNCDCPAEYTGKDVWHSFKSCHVPKDTIKLFNYLYLGFNCLAFVVTFSALCWALVSCRNVRSGAFPLNDRTLVDTRKRHMVMTLFTLFCSPLFGLPYSFLNTLNPPMYRYEATNGFSDISLGISFALIYMAFWFILYAYYKSFPDLATIGKLLNVKSTLVSQPKLFYKVVWYHAVVEAVVVSATLGFLPALFYGDNDTRSVVSRIAGVLNAIFVLEFNFVFGAVSIVIRKLYITASDGAKVTKASKVKIQRAIQNITLIIYGVVLVNIVAAIPFTALPTEYGRRHTFALWFGVAVCGYGLTILGSVVFARELFNIREPAVVLSQKDKQETMSSSSSSL